jgi:hypothetical protein
LDKILQNNVMPPDRLVPKEDSRAIIFLRSPESTIRSIVTMLVARTDPSQPTPTVESAAEYYMSRLQRLRDDGERMGERALYFDAETLIQRPDRLLAALSSWLELKTPLTSDYRVLPRTGEFGFGDPSDNIRSGRILDSSKSTIASDIHVSKPILLEAESTYQQCRASLIAHCHVVEEGLWREDATWHELTANDPA